MSRYFATPITETLPVIAGFLAKLAPGMYNASRLLAIFKQADATFPWINAKCFGLAMTALQVPRYRREDGNYYAVRCSVQRGAVRCSVQRGRPPLTPEEKIARAEAILAARPLTREEKAERRIELYNARMVLSDLAIKAMFP